MLEVEDLHAWYGRSHVLQGINIRVQRGEIVALIGRNGAGKTTTLKAIMGLIDKVKGKMLFVGETLDERVKTHQRFRMGLGYVPEERRIIPGLTVYENLRLGILYAANKADEKEILADMLKQFPRLGERVSQEAVTMSGGEQQLLAIARAMVSKPKLIALDEPSEGVMPTLVDEMFQIFESLKREGVGILLVEQNVELTLEIADRVYIVDQGEVVHHGTAADLSADKEIQERYCSV
ncbi:MAG: ABC transporter ATP-binding protein [Candidatus Cloacimonetes bacterium]|nr:ABC transporter ATP-binding protein [Candidatus Cloacimonadota bacterium]